jgi:hypothetical protein
MAAPAMRSTASPSLPPERAIAVAAQDSVYGAFADVHAFFQPIREYCGQSVNS